jgi:hypothetical protein
MNTQRLNITLPLREIARLQAKPNKSAFIAEAVREKLDREDCQRREEELALAYRQESHEELRLAKQWDRLSGEGL